jgi:hypothetical protein
MELNWNVCPLDCSSWTFSLPIKLSCSGKLKPHRENTLVFWFQMKHPMAFPSAAADTSEEVI